MKTTFKNKQIVVDCELARQETGTPLVVDEVDCELARQETGIRREVLA